MKINQRTILNLIQQLSLRDQYRRRHTASPHSRLRDFTPVVHVIAYLNELAVLAVVPEGTVGFEDHDVSDLQTAHLIDESFSEWSLVCRRRLVHDVPELDVGQSRESFANGDNFDWILRWIGYCNCTGDLP